METTQLNLVIKNGIRNSKTKQEVEGISSHPELMLKILSNISFGTIARVDKEERKTSISHRKPLADGDKEQGTQVSLKPYTDGGLAKSRSARECPSHHPYKFKCTDPWQKVSVI